MMTAVAESIGVYLFSALVIVVGVHWMLRLFRDTVLSFDERDSAYDAD